MRLIPNALSLARGLLAIPFALCMASSTRLAAGLAAGALLLAIASDLLDGAIARRTGQESALGRTLDHGADFAFVMAGLVAGSAREAWPWLLPLLVALAFGQYVIDSYWLHRAGRLRMSALGRWNGVLYFVPLVGDVLVRLGLPSLAPLVLAIAWTLIATTLVSIADRLVNLSWSRSRP